MDRAIVVVSNRGPVSFVREPDGSFTAKRGAGGLVSSLAPLIEGTGAEWIAAAVSDDDRAAAARGMVDAAGFRLLTLPLDVDDYRMAYDVVSNATLWFLHHGLYDLPRRPRFDRYWREAWEGYRRVNGAFADAVVETAPRDAVVLVQDYHLALVGAHLRERRPDLHAVHFTHTPFCGPNSIRVLPEYAAEELLSGMAAYDACGFHATRWARAFAACCNEVLGRAPRTYVSPIAPDAADLRRVAESDAAAAAGRDLDARVGDHRMILRVDRIELSKNLLRGFLAFDDLLREHPEWRERVVFFAFVYPSRVDLAEYQSYRQEVEGLVGRINAEWGTARWTPILLDTDDDFPRSVAALARYDVLLVNPVKDGLNLVAKEGPLLNEKDGVLLLSREAGAWEELHDVAVGLNPFDVSATADLLHEALSIDEHERRLRAAALRLKAGGRTPRDWLDDQLRAAIGEPPN
jgi:trehalose 6-phosphate synthase